MAYSMYSSCTTAQSSQTTFCSSNTTTPSTHTAVKAHAHVAALSAERGSVSLIGLILIAKCEMFDAPTS